MAWLAELLRTVVLPLEDRAVELEERLVIHIGGGLLKVPQRCAQVEGSRFVSGYGFSRAAAVELIRGFSPCAFFFSRCRKHQCCSEAEIAAGLAIDTKQISHADRVHQSGALAAVPPRKNGENCGDRPPPVNKPTADYGSAPYKQDGLELRAGGTLGRGRS